MDVWFKDTCRDLENRYGRGWKRRLAELVGVSDSNVQSWIKVGRVPPAVRSAIENAERVRELEQELENHEDEQKCFVAMDENGGAVVLSQGDDGVPVYLARFRVLDDAFRFRSVASGELDRRITDVLDHLWDYLDGHPDDQATLERLRNWAQKPKAVELAESVQLLNSMLEKEGKDHA